MVFSSTFFVFCFLPITVLLYYCNPFGLKVKNLILVASSLFFYAYGEPKYIFLMLLSIMVNHFVALTLETKYGKTMLILGTIYNVLMLFVFKYLGWVLDLLRPILGEAGASLEVNIALPIGISFYTFQAMSYLFDVWNKKATPQKNIMNTMLYISFFGQLVAGPIVRYDLFASQTEDRICSLGKMIEGIKKFIYGLGKKVLIANQLGMLSDIVFKNLHGNDSLTVMTAWLGAIAYTLQIYFDFSGYSDMAIGIGKMFGFDFLENFNYPYIAKSITEFWRRWHMSLSFWFRDYVYIPLGGNRLGRKRQIVNIFVVWMLTGLWHGANTTFVVWGVLYGILLIVEKNIPQKTMQIKVLPRVFTLLVVMMAWVIFNSPSLVSAVEYIGIMFGIGGQGIWELDVAIRLFTIYRVYIILAIVGATPCVISIINRAKKYLWGQCAEMLYLGVVLFLAACSMANSAYNPFIYFNF